MVKDVIFLVIIVIINKLIFFKNIAKIYMTHFVVLKKQVLQLANWVICLIIIVVINL